MVEMAVMVHGDRYVVWIAQGMLCGVCELWCGSDVQGCLSRRHDGS